MTAARSRPTALQALGNRLSASWDCHFGWPAALALLLAMAAIGVHWQLRPALQRESAALLAQRVQAEQLAAQRGAVAAVPPNPLAAMAPTVVRRGRDVGVLLEAARRSGLEVEHADYAVDALPGAPVTRLHALLPVTGSYGDVRKFIARVLNTLPNSALESLQLERTTTQSARLQATLRIVLFYQAEGQ